MTNYSIFEVGKKQRTCWFTVIPQFLTSVLPSAPL